jgi:CRISPR system Cascade subunit CasB
MQIDIEIAIFDWWKSLESNKKGRAELRRAKNLEHVFYLPEFYALYKKLSHLGWRSEKNIALVVSALSHVRFNVQSQTVSSQMAKPVGKSRAVFSDLRFRRLLQRDSADEMLIPIIRVIRMLDGKVNISDLAESLYWWNIHTKRKWALDYYKNTSI